MLTNPPPMRFGLRQVGVRLLAVLFAVGLALSFAPPPPAHASTDAPVVGDIDVTYECTSIDVLSVQEISNVVLEFADGTQQKFDDLDGLEGSFAGTGDNAGKVITTAWVKSANNKSGDGPGFGERFDFDTEVCSAAGGGSDVGSGDGSGSGGDGSGSGGDGSGSGGDGSGSGGDGSGSGGDGSGSGGDGSDSGGDGSGSGGDGSGSGGDGSGSGGDGSGSGGDGSGSGGDGSGSGGDGSGSGGDGSGSGGDGSGVGGDGSGSGGDGSGSGGDGSGSGGDGSGSGGDGSGSGGDGSGSSGDGSGDGSDDDLTGVGGISEEVDGAPDDTTQVLGVVLDRGPSGAADAGADAADAGAVAADAGSDGDTPDNVVDVDVAADGELANTGASVPFALTLALSLLLLGVTMLRRRPETV